MSIPTQARVLVTGATGMLGSHAVQALLARGHQVTALVRDEAKAARVFGDQPVILRRGDIAAEDTVARALDGCNAVIHCAAVIAFDTAKDPRALIETNVAGVRNVVGKALELGVERVVHVSSIAPLFRSDGQPITEDAELQPSKRAYSQSKMEADLYVRALQGAGKPVKILYPGAIIGPDDPGLTESMHSIQIFANQFLPLTTSGIQYVDVRDLGYALAKMIEDTPGAKRYIAAGHFLTWPELAEALERATGKRPPAYRVPAWTLRLAGTLSDALRWLVPIDLPVSTESVSYVTRWTPIENSKDFERLGVQFRPVEESIADSVAWLRAAGHL